MLSEGQIKLLKKFLKDISENANIDMERSADKEMNHYYEGKILIANETLSLINKLELIHEDLVK